MNRKLTIFFVALLVSVFAASSAMAWTLNSRSEEMTANSRCDFAGTITLTFGPSDADIINAYLADPANEYVLIRVSLSGTDLGADPEVPLLCKDIAGTVDGTGLGANGGDLPNSGELVAIDETPIELSDNAAAQDITAYVYGEEGDQFFEIYITGIVASADAMYSDVSTYPFIKVGLYDELDLAGGQENTAICADVQSFSGLSKLTVSIDNTPSSLSTTTSDNQIGHFLAADIDIVDCVKDELAVCPIDETIEDCPVTIGSGGQSVSCDTYTYCFTAVGDFPMSTDIVINLRTNGATSSATTQDGVYLFDVTLRDEDDNVLVGGGLDYTITYANEDPAACSISGSDVDYADTISAMIEINTDAFVAGSNNTLKFCVEYLVDPDEVAPGDDAQLWVDSETLPCGSLFSSTETMASIIECGSTPFCMYFPYVLTGSSPWQTGIVVSNVGSDVAPSDMEVLFTLTDSTGTQFTYTKDDFTAVVYPTFLDTMLTEFSGTPAAGPAWLKVQGNFVIDGYSFLTNSIFGAGTLPRPLESCTAEGPMMLP